MGERWYVVQAKYKDELFAAKNLSDQGFDVFCPMYRVPVRKEKAICECHPFYPTYLFVKFDIERHYWSRIKNTRGVRFLLTCREETATPVPIGFVESLIESADGNFLRVNTEKNNSVKLTIGMNLRVKLNNYNGLVGICERIDRHSVVLFTTLLSRKIKIRIPISFVEGI